MPAPRTHYDILNVAHDAEAVVIEAAFRALMKKYHPDQGAPAAEGAPSAARINEAFAVLRDAARRADYDHHEWTRAQNIQLAQYPPPAPPRQSNFFGWGGWLVALLLAGMIALIAGRNGGVPPLSNSEEARAAALPEPELRSQPSAPRDSVSAAESAEIQADALRLPVAARTPATERSRPAAEPAPTVEAGRAEPVSRYRRVVIARSARYRAARHRGGRRPANKDFVEQQGGIY